MVLLFEKAVRCVFRTAWTINEYIIPRNFDNVRCNSRENIAPACLQTIKNQARYYSRIRWFGHRRILRLIHDRACFKFLLLRWPLPSGTVSVNTTFGQSGTTEAVPTFLYSDGLGLWKRAAPDGTVPATLRAYALSGRHTQNAAPTMSI